MTLIDANVLLYADYARAPQHERCRTWVEVELASGGAAVRLPWATIVTFLRISTNPRVHESAAHESAGLDGASEPGAL